MDFSNLPIGMYQVVWKDEIVLYQKKILRGLLIRFSVFLKILELIIKTY